MSLRYDFNASNLAARRFNPQLQHLGVIEFEIENLIGRSSREFLGLGISSFDLPQVRSVSKVTVHYLNGSVNYPGKPEAVGDLTVVFNDYIDGRQRAILLEWFKFVYDKRSGLGGLPSDIKVDAYAVLLSQDGGNRAVYRMKGLFPLSDPPLPPVNYQDTGTIVQMSINFSVDEMFEIVMGGETFNIASSGAGARAGTLSSLSSVSSIDRSLGQSAFGLAGGA